MIIKNNMFKKNYVFLLLSSCTVLFVGYWIYATVSHATDLQKDMYALENIYNKSNIVPVLVIGSGCAGYSAALYAARRGFLTVQLLGDQPGGQLLRTTQVDNFPGSVDSQGPDIMGRLKTQAQNAGVFMISQKATKIDTHSWPYKVETEDGLQFNCLTIIFTPGSSPSLLQIPGEQEYWGKGVTTCAICDAPLYKGKNADVIVVGGGDSAAEEAIQLAPYACSITIMVRKDKMIATEHMQARLQKIPSITISFNTEVKEIIGDGAHVQAVKIYNNRTHVTEIKPVQGVFLAIGHKPNSALVEGQLNLDARGYVLYKGRTQQTSKLFIFAAGDIGDPFYKQAVIAAGDGAKASIEAAHALEHDLGLDAAAAKELAPYCFAGVSRHEEPHKPLQEIHSIEELEQICAADNSLCILDCYTEICPSCKEMMPVLEQAAVTYANKITFVKANMSDSDIAKKYHVSTVPTLLVFKDGALVARINKALLCDQLDDFVQRCMVA